MKELLFNNPEFHLGLNFTVRLGTKWKNALEVGDYILIGSLKVLIRKIYSCRFAEIPQEVLNCEHDPLCRTLDSLFAVMKVVYPELALKPHDDAYSTVVTCVGFLYNPFIIN